MQLLRFFVVVLGLVVSAPAFSNYVFTSPPRETPQKGQEIYKPLAKYLSKITGKPVTYQHPGSWEKYSNDMRNDKYDFVFDGPHFAAWRIKHLKHKPLVRLRGDLSFHVVTRVDNSKISSAEDVRQYKTCGIASPNLSTLSFVAHYKNGPKPRLIAIKGGMKKVYQAFKNGKCDVAILRDSFYKRKIAAVDRDKLKVVFTTRPLPNQTLTVSSRIDNDTANSIQDGLRSLEGAKSARKLLMRFSKRSPTFRDTSSSLYRGRETFLEGQVPGW